VHVWLCCKLRNHDVFNSTARLLIWASHKAWIFPLLKTSLVFCFLLLFVCFFASFGWLFFGGLWLRCFVKLPGWNSWCFLLDLALVSALGVCTIKFRIRRHSKPSALSIYQLICGRTDRYMYLPTYVHRRYLFGRFAYTHTHQRRLVQRSCPGLYSTPVNHLFEGFNDSTNSADSIGARHY